MTSHNNIEQTLDDLGEWFYDWGFEESKIVAIEDVLGIKLTRLLRTALAKIGDGAFSLTGGFFCCDNELEESRRLREQLKQGLPTAVSGIVDSEFSVPANLLCIGKMDFASYFVSEFDSEDPLVRCFIEEQGVARETHRLSDLLSSFVGIDQPQEIPLHLVDERWYVSHIGYKNHLNPYLRWQEIESWRKDGRAGFPEKFLVHPDIDIEDYLDGQEILFHFYQ